MLVKKTEKEICYENKNLFILTLLKYLIKVILKVTIFVFILLI